MRRRPWNESVKASILTSRPLASDTNTPDALLCDRQYGLTYDWKRYYLSVAKLSLAIALRSSVLFAVLILVNGVPIALPLVEPAGVVEEDAVPPTPALFFAAFSASLFCFEAEGGITMDKKEKRCRISIVSQNFGKISRGSNWCGCGESVIAFDYDLYFEATHWLHLDLEEKIKDKDSRRGFNTVYSK